jgi:N-methylhydantoinase A
MSARVAKRVGVDVGGTFTDCVVLDESGHMTVTKSSTTSPQSIGVMNAFAKQSVELADIELFVHGTTVATNAIVQKKGGPAALFVTKGTGDLFIIQRGNRARLYDVEYSKTPSVLPRHDIIEVDERVDASGRVVQDLDVGSVLPAVRAFVGRGYRSFGICFLFSYANPEHEQRLQEAIRSEFGPDITVSLSSAIAPEWKELERATTTAINAYLIPTVSGYLTDLRSRLHSDGLRSDFLVMQSNGGLMTSSAAERLPCRILWSGPGAGAQAGAITAVQAGFQDALTLDMGGTSTDIALVQAGRIDVRHTTELAFGLPLKGSAIDVESIGSGGGSIARVDKHGRLLVGPESAGSHPGPAAYGRGGQDATFVDAAVILAWLDAAQPLAGGEVYIDTDRARDVVGKVGKALGLDAIKAAEGITRVSLGRIIEACHSASIGRGRDPRRMALIAFGGAGPLVAPFVAHGLGMEAVIVPPHPGAHSAAGLLLSDFRYDFAQTRPIRSQMLDSDFIENVFQACESEANELLRQERLDDENVIVRRGVEARYFGQTHTVTIDVPVASNPAQIVEAFHRRHEALYSYQIPSREVEFVTWRLTTVIANRTRQSQRRRGNDGQLESLRTLTMIIRGESVEARVYDRSTLPVDSVIEGPALVVQMDSSILIPPGDLASVDGHGNLVIRVGGGKML